MDLYAGVTAHVHTLGQLRSTSWREEPHGFFPDGEPQRWAHQREVWIAYEFWARAKGVATGIIGSHAATAAPRRGG